MNLSDFFDFIYGEQEGYAYSPIKDPETSDWQQYFYHWPTEKDKLINHVKEKQSVKEVYYSPGLYSKRQADKDAFLGTSVVWAEFDDGVPTGKDIPEPSIKIRSSTEDHEHWYWKLEDFQTDSDAIEDITHKLAYSLKADLGCWNSNRVLRPPGTTHHESGRQVQILHSAKVSYQLKDFNGLPSLPMKVLQDSDINHIPAALEVIAKYPWPKEELDFFSIVLRQEEVKVGQQP